MKKKIAAALLLAAAFLPGCAKQIQAAPLPKDTSAPVEIAEGAELFAAAETREEAEEIAALYGVELVDFSYGVATFHTQEDPGEVIRRGEGKDWPTLEVNTVTHLS